MNTSPSTNANNQKNPLFFFLLGAKWTTVEKAERCHNESIQRIIVSDIQISHCWSCAGAEYSGRKGTEGIALICYFKMLLEWGFLSLPRSLSEHLGNIQRKMLKGKAEREREKSIPVIYKNKWCLKKGKALFFVPFALFPPTSFQGLLA